MPRIRIVSPGFTAYTGILSGVQITNGVTADIPQWKANALAAAFQTVVVASDGTTVIGPNGKAATVTPRARVETKLDVYADRISFVATRGQVMNGLTPASVQGQSASYHVMQDDCAWFEAHFPNWYVTSAGVETGPGADATLEVFIEYPIFSTPRRVKIAGQDVGSIPNGGSTAVLIEGEFKKGTPYRLLTYRTCASGVIYHAGGSALHLGEKGQFAATVAKTIATGVIGGSDYSNYYGPTHITGKTDNRTVAILDDSIGDGYLDVPNDYHGDRGVWARSLGRDYAYANLSVPGDRAVWFIASNTRRRAIASLASDVMIGYGRNDLGNGRTGAQVNADTTTIAGYFPNARVYSRTLAPWSTSTDNWASNANQTATTSANDVNTVNVERTARKAPFVYCADVFVIMSDRNGPFTPKWKTDASQTLAKFYTTDGTHPNERCNDAIVRSGVVRLV